eukprot:CAMPEP_0174314584 /NCGR_PEP_ID=MMETSP0810-20121108/5733_1 /TAXON_ID=73025 ORGANISM="Eutreptiella gymnastica-like, Strain CCMP1594" /NCGR_SAMPLE_ID=MMETSP0810 /ASSEMBLY_ACC=CAM_ASM_000659 /LENGTH=113 /DNA_ID=CAMNT_0015423717 /DNA_START=253 /DNA_END=594 /DNA_ORIENTATION=-
MVSRNTRSLVALAGSTSCLLTTQQPDLRSLWCQQRELIEGDAFTSCTLNGLAGRCRESERADTHLRKPDSAFIVQNISHDHGDGVRPAFLPQRQCELGGGHWGPVVPAHHQPL